MKKNVVHFITGLNTGGAEIMLLKLLSAINLDKYNILVVSLIDKGAIGQKIEALGIKVYTLNLSSKLPVTFSLLSLPFVLKRFEPNIFHGWMYHANLLLSFISSENDELNSITLLVSFFKIGIFEILVLTIFSMFDLFKLIFLIFLLEE